MKPDADRAVGRAAIAAALTVILIVVATVAVLVRPSSREWVRERLTRAAPAFEVGSASGLPGAWSGDSAYTVLIFATTGCDACRRAFPFHQQLVRAADGASSLRARVVLTSPDDDEAAYAALMGIRADQITTFGARGTKLRRVPTIVILNRHGVVVETKEGVLSDDEQHALLEMVKTLR